MGETDKKSASSKLNNKPGGTPLDAANQELLFNTIYTGIVIKVDAANGTCTVLTRTPGKEINDVVWATGSIMAPLLGFKTRTIPTLGSKVAILYAEPSFVIQVFSQEPSDTKKSNKKSHTGMSYRSDKEVYADGRVAGPVVDADALEGEFDISNAMNVGLLFLNNLMVMRAGDRAKVETHLLNDMVRIISEVYRHHSSFGDFEIYNDGRLNVEWHGTSYEHESYNESDPKKPKAPTKNTEVDFSQVQDGSMFKQRFSQYLGYLGDFVHLFIREPQQTSNSIITGKARFQIQASGTMLFTTTDEIVFERATRVVIPRRIKEHDAEDGAQYMDYLDKKLPTEPLIEWDYGQGNKNIHHTAYQLREYARYVSYTKSLARFRQLEGKDFTTPSEQDTPAPSYSNQEQDREEINGTVPFYETYSTIRMLRGGGIILVAGDGSCLNLGNRQATLSSVDKLILESGGDMVLTAGGNLFTTAYKDIHHTSITGGIIQKARKRFHLLVERGLAWIKSDANPENTETGQSGVYLDAADGDVVVNGKRNVCLRSEDQDVVLKAGKGSIISKAREDLVQISEKGVHFTQALGGGALMQCKNIQMLARKVRINQDVVFGTQSVDIGPRVKMRSSLSVDGNIRSTVKVEKLGGKYRHWGHIRLSSQPQPPLVPDNTLTNMASELTAKTAAAEEVISGLDASVWKYEDQDFPDQRADGTPNSAYRSVSQDYIMTHDTVFGSTYSDWDFEQENMLKDGPRTEPTLPYPGEKSNQEMVHPLSAGSVLDKPGTSTEFVQTPLEAQDIKRKRKN